MPSWLKTIKANKNLRLAIKAVISLIILIFTWRSAAEEFLSLISARYFAEGGVSLESIGRAALSAFNIPVALALGMLMCCGVFKIEQLISVYKKCGERKGLAYAFYFSTTFALTYNPLDKLRLSVTDFSRIIGNGIVSDVDVLKRTDNFYMWFAAFGISFVIFYLLANYWKHQERNGESKKAENFLDHFMVAANCGLVLSCTTYFAVFYNLYSYLTIPVILITLLYISMNLGRYIKTEHFAALSLSTVSIGYAVVLTAAFQWKSAIAPAGILFAVFCVILFLLYRDCTQKKDGWITSLCAVTPIPAGIPLATSLYIEAVHILNQYGVFVTEPGKYYKILFMSIVFVFLGVSVMFKKTGRKITGWKNLAYPVFIAGVACLSVQIPISSTYSPDLFEGANAGILISDFLNFGKIPIVEHYGGHMMMAVWEGILYGLVNQDYAGAAASPYHVLLYFPALVLLFFYLVKKIWNEDMAFWATLIFPFYSFWQTYGLGMLVCIAAMAYIRKNTYTRAVLFWASAVWCAMYRLDLGYAFAIASMITMLSYIIATRNKRAAKQLGATFAGFCAAGLAAWFILCAAKGIQPVSRLYEFLMISLSNQNWAYSHIGSTSIMLFSWAYMFIPFACVLCLLYVTFASRFRQRTGLEIWVLMQILGWSYFVNFPRGIVRHSLAEMATPIIMWCVYLFLAIFWSFYRNNKKEFLPAFMALNLCGVILASSTIFTRLPIAYESAWRHISILANWKQLANVRETVKRVKFNESLEAYAEKFRIIDVLLEKDETFADFINKTLLYSLLGRECPSYVSQSPLQLSGEFTQLEFIKEIERCPIVLMPVDGENFRATNSLDGVTNAYRYYKVSEYIYQNYVPLCSYGTDYAVWCRPDRYETYRDKLSKSMQSPLRFIDYGYDGPVMEYDDKGISYKYISMLHDHDLYHLPRIWAEGDRLDSNKNKILSELKNYGEYYVIPQDFARAGSEGNYLKITAALDGEESNAVVIMGRAGNGVFDEKVRYSMIFKEGLHDYLIRCSTDYYWYTGDINAVKIISDGALNDVELKILEGD